MANKLPAKVGKGNSLFYALIVAGFLTWNTISWSYNKEEGWNFKSKEVPLAIVTPCLVLMGVALGINLSGAFKAIADIAIIATRNSAAINKIAAQHSLELSTKEDIQPSETDEQL